MEAGSVWKIGCALSGAVPRLVISPCHIRRHILLCLFNDTMESAVRPGLGWDRRA